MINKEYSSKISASVLLLDGKIYSWKVGQHFWESPNEAIIRVSDLDRINQMETKYKTWVVHNNKEQNNALNEVENWFKQWEIHKDCIGNKPY